MLTPRQIFEELQHYYQVGYNHVSFDTKDRINSLALNILTSMSDVRFCMTREETKALLTCIPGLANVLAMSSMETSDKILEQLQDKGDSWPQLMVLTSVRNRIQTSPSFFFDRDPELASLWYEMFLIPAAGRTSRLLYQNTIEHLKNLDMRYTPTHRATTLYFLPNYIDNELARSVKGYIAQKLSETATPIFNAPVRESIAIVSDNWRPGHAVYKSMYQMVAELAKTHRLTLVTSDTSDKIDGTLFEDIAHVAYRGDYLDVGEIQENDFSLAFFCDVGMTPETMALACHRIAPTQVAGHGHPCSTYSPTMDYFLSGSAVESPDLDIVDSNYSEHAIYTPGSGNIPRPVDVPPRCRATFTVGDKCVVNIPWGVVKYNHPMLLLLADIQNASQVPIQYHFQVGCGLDRYNCAWPFFRDMEQIFGGDKAIYIPNKPYLDYFDSLQKGQFALDNYPFGGYNSVVDNLCAGRPIVTWEGTEWYNRVGSYLLRSLGLDELIVTNSNDYKELALKLANDLGYYEKLAQKMLCIDLSTVFNTDEPKHFSAIIRTLAH